MTQSTTHKSYTGCSRLSTFTFRRRTLYELSKFGVDEICGICSSKDIAQPLFHAEILNFKYLLKS